jgi:tight adherence protein B
VSGVLMLTALALLSWPDGGGRRRRRLRAVTGPAARRTRAPRLPVEVLAAVGCGAVGAVLSTPLVAGLAAVVAFLVARSWTGRRLEGREEERLRALTDGLAALGADLRSGRSLTASTEAAVEACADADTGAALARALRAPDAVPSPSGGEVRAALDRVAAGVLLSARTGCSLAAVTAAVEDDLRARRRLRLELRTATAGPRASAMMLAGLPALGLAMGSGVGADPWRVLTTTGTGQALLVAGVILELAGLAWSGRLVRRALR